MKAAEVIGDIVIVMSVLVGSGVVVHQHDVHAEHKHAQPLYGRITHLEGEVSSLKRDIEDRDERLAQAAERDRARRVRASRSRRAALPVLAWTHSRHGIQIANCESADLQHWPWSDGSRYLGGEKGVHLHDQATYTGKWQIGPTEWRDWGGLQYAAAPYLATEYEQDIVAEEGYRRRGEQPWDCARKV